MHNPTEKHQTAPAPAPWAFKAPVLVPIHVDQFSFRAGQVRGRALSDEHPISDRFKLGGETFLPGLAAHEVTVQNASTEWPTGLPYFWRRA